MYPRTVQRPRQRQSQVHAFLAPTAGWIANRNLAAPSQGAGAAILDNFFPLSSTAILRRGKARYATLGLGEVTDEVQSIFAYLNGATRRLFASRDDTIFDITSVAFPDNWTLGTEDGDEIGTEGGDVIGGGSTDSLVVWSGALGGKWITAQTATTGGIYLVGVNGASMGFIYDGEGFWPYVEGGVWELGYDNQSIAFVPGETVTGGSSGASATIYAVEPARLILTDVTNGPFIDDEAITGSIAGAADADGEEETIVPGIDFDNEPDLTTADMAYVWSYKNRLFFVEKDSLSIWYLDVDAIGGTAARYPMGGIFPRGGSVLWGATWSLDSGAEGGLSEQCVVMTTEGEAAIFQGTSPDDAESWGKVGVYRIGRPLGNRAHFRGGGDVVVASSVGLVPLSKAITLDVTALSPATVSFNIADAWQAAIDQRGMEGWECEVWPEQKMAVISPPGVIGGFDPVLFVANTETGAWCRFTGWDARAMEVFQGELYFGGQNGAIFKANRSGLDDGAPFTGAWLTLFDDFGSAAAVKVPQLGRVAVRGRAPVDSEVAFHADFDLDLGAQPPPSVVLGTSVWGEAVWGQATWGGSIASAVSQEWQQLGGIGYACAMSAQITSGSIAPLDAEIIRMDMTFTISEVVS